jgi:hypothetical protein
MSYSIRLGDIKYVSVFYKMFYYYKPVNCIAVNLVNKTETNKTSVIKTTIIDTYRRILIISIGHFTILTQLCDFFVVF